jgi:hypothetical protein
VEKLRLTASNRDRLPRELAERLGVKGLKNPRRSPA